MEKYKLKYTHYIECFTYVGKSKKRRYFQKCIFIEMAKNSKAKVKVREGNEYIRYVNKNRLIKMYENV